ncbi:hypothetical protein P5V15_009851 [Pogonomyrmex californicus]
MWKIQLNLNILITLIVTKLVKADYMYQDQYQQSKIPFKCIEEGYYPDPYDCRVYYRCVDWGNKSPLTTFKFECGVGTVFSKDNGNICTHPNDSGRSECDDSENEIDSNVQNIPSWTTTVRTTIRPQSTILQSSITTKLSTIMTEAITTTRKPSTTQSSLINQSNTDQSENNVINCQNEYQCTQEGFFGDICDCRKFYRCVDDNFGKFKKYDFICGTGTFWDPKSQGCNHAWAISKKNCKYNLESGSDINNNGQWSGNNTGDNSGQGNDISNQSSQPGKPEDSNQLDSLNPGSPGYPGSSGYPGSPGYPEAPDSSNSPSFPEYPGTLSPPSTSVPSDNPSFSEYPGIPEYPSPISPNLSSSGYPETSGFPSIPVSTDSPDFPKYPGTLDPPATSDSLVSGSPGYPGTIDSASPSGISDNPISSTSLASGYPGPTDSSDSPNSLGYPESAGSPSFPNNLGSPGYPEASSSPSSPLSPGLCTSEGFFGDTKDCRKFYRCVNNDISFIKYEFQCGDGTVWDSSIQSCNHAFAVPHCNQLNGIATNEPDISLNEIDGTNKPDINKLPSSGSSTYSTISMKPEFSTQAINITNSPTAASQMISVSYLPPISSTYLPSTTQVTGSISYISAATQMINTSTSYLPSSTVTTNTASVTTTESISYLPPSSQNGKLKCIKEGFFPNPDNCKKFYRCVRDQSGYQKYEFECSPGTAWDQSLQTCNHIQQVVSCSTNSNEIDQNFSSSTSIVPVMSTFTTIVSNQTIPTTSSSVIFTESTISTIPNKVSTESTTLEIDKMELSTTTIDTSISTSTKPTSEKPEGMQVFESSSTKNPSSSLSTSESNKESLSTESYVSNCTTQKPINTIVCNNEGFYPHPSKCNKFYRCVNNGNSFNVYHFDCPPGTIFDPSINVCNYPESVYPTRDNNCTIEDTTSSNVSMESTTQSPELPEQSTSIKVSTTIQSITEQTEESTITSTEFGVTSTMEIISEESTASSAELTSNMPENMENMTKSTTESNIGSTEVVTDSSISEQSSSKMTTEITSTEFEMSTTESQEQSTLESQEQSTQSKEPSSTEAHEQLTTELQEQSTIVSQEQTTELSTTMEPVVTAPCSIGNLTDDQITLICPTGFRRHPKYCNLFYQCTSENNMEIKILILNCPENTIFDEKKIQCLPENENSQPCTGTRTSARFYRKLENNALSSIKVSSNRLCPEEGHFPYQQGCSNTFYKCKRNSRNNLEGYLYKCPDNFVYWSVSRRCERVTRLPMCPHLYKNKIDWNDRWQVPIEDFNLSARMLRFF